MSTTVSAKCSSFVSISALTKAVTTFPGAKIEGLAIELQHNGRNCTLRLVPTEKKLTEGTEYNFDAAYEFDRKSSAEAGKVYALQFDSDYKSSIFEVFGPECNHLYNVYAREAAAEFAEKHNILFNVSGNATEGFVGSMELPEAVENERAQ